MVNIHQDKRGREGKRKGGREERERGRGREGGGGRGEGKERGREEGRKRGKGRWGERKGVERKGGRDLWLPSPTIGHIAAIYISQGHYRFII